MRTGKLTAGKKGTEGIKIRFARSRTVGQKGDGKELSQLIGRIREVTDIRSVPAFCVFHSRPPFCV